MAQWTGDQLDLTFEHVDELDVRIVGGEANVSAGIGPVRVEVEVLRGPPAEVRFESGRLTVTHEPERSIMGLVGGGVKVVVSVVVPEATATTVRTVSAEAFVAGLRGDTSVTTVSGGVTATGLDGDVTIRSVSGDIEAQGLDGSLRTDSVSGDVTVSAGVLRSARSKTVSGDVTLDLQSVPEINCVSISGDVAVRLPADADLDLEVATVSGHLDTNFPEDGLEIMRRRMRGRIGSGGPPATVRTTSGNVVVLRAESVAPEVAADAAAR
jgi:hypothetical protein